jgi:hypothetical protein
VGGGGLHGRCGHCEKSIFFIALTALIPLILYITGFQKRNGKDLEGSGKGLFQCTIPPLAKSVEEISHGIAGNQEKIRTAYLPNTFLECYRYTSPCNNFTVLSERHTILFILFGGGGE